MSLFLNGLRRLRVNHKELRIGHFDGWCLSIRTSLLIQLLRGGGIKNEFKKFKFISAWINTTDRIPFLCFLSFCACCSPFLWKWKWSAWNILSQILKQGDEKETAIDLSDVEKIDVELGKIIKTGEEEQQMLDQGRGGKGQGRKEKRKRKMRDDPLPVVSGARLHFQLFSFLHFAQVFCGHIGRNPLSSLTIYTEPVHKMSRKYAICWWRLFYFFLPFLLISITIKAPPEDEVTFGE